jgi:hypothetical protein
MASYAMLPLLQREGYSKEFRAVLKQNMEQLQLHRVGGASSSSSSSSGQALAIDAEVLIRFTHEWLSKLQVESCTVMRDKGISMNEFVFKCRMELLASAIQVSRANENLKLPLLEILPLTTEIAIQCCLHATSKIPPFPTQEVRQHLEYKIALYISQHMYEGTLVTMLNLKKRLAEIHKDWRRQKEQDGQDYQIESFVLWLEDLRVPASLKEAYIALKCARMKAKDGDDDEDDEEEKDKDKTAFDKELELAGVPRYTHEDMERDRRKQMEIEEQEAEEEEEHKEWSDEAKQMFPRDEYDAIDAQDDSRGWLWQTHSDNIVLNFFPIAAGLISQWTLEDVLIRSECVQKARQVPITTRDRVQTWMREKTVLDYSSTLLPVAFVETGMELILPMGARQRSMRQKATYAEWNAPASEVMEREIGPDMYHILRQRYKTLKFADITANQQHEYYPLFLLVMFSYQIKQLLPNVDVLKNYFITASQVRLNTFHDPIMVAKNAKGIPLPRKAKKRPKMVFMQRKWWVTHTLHEMGGSAAGVAKEEWFECQDTYEMIFQWLYLLRKHRCYQNQTEQGHEIKSPGYLLRQPDRWIENVFAQEEE